LCFGDDWALNEDSDSALIANIFANVFQGNTKPAEGKRSSLKKSLDDKRLFEIVRDNQPCTVRNVYYLAISEGLIDKDSGGKRNNYQKVIRALGDMREQDIVPWSWIVDNTRSIVDGRWRDDFTPQIFLQSEIETFEYRYSSYQKNPWLIQPKHLEVWCESDSVRGVIQSVVTDKGIDLLACRGQSSKIFVHNAAQSHGYVHDREIVILYVGDWDPTGLAIPVSVQERMQRYGSQEFQFNRIAVTPQLITDMHLIDKGHDPNQNDPNYQRFIRECDSNNLDYASYESEAINPNDLRGLVSGAIESYIDVEAWHKSEREQEEGREWLKSKFARLREMAEELIPEDYRDV
jgi:hypothetical protein